MRTSDAMQRHDFDPVAFVFGLLFTGSGLLFMLGRFDVLNHARWLWPGLLVLLGIAVLIRARGGPQTRSRAVGGTATEPVVHVPDLDTIEPPVGPEAFRLPGWPPPSAERPKATGASAIDRADTGSTTDVLEPAEAAPEPAGADPHADTEVIDQVDREAETRPLPRRPEGEEPPASG